MKKVLLSEKEEVREVRAESQEEGRSPDGWRAQGLLLRECEPAAD